MRKTGLSLIVFGLLAAVSLPTSASAQATRTWVSGVGDDANPCSRTAPCKTFAGAISKTAPGGEIDCLDPAGFGALTITKSITIDCTAVSGGILAAATTGLIINTALGTDEVVIRNLVIQGTDGTSIGFNGIRFLAGKELHLDRVVVQGFSTVCVEVNKSAGGSVFVRDSYFTECPTGINFTGTGATAAQIDNSRFVGLANTGIAISGPATAVTVSNSVFSSITGTGVSVTATGATVNLINNVFSNNLTGISANSGTNLRTSNNDLYDNTTGISVAAGGTWLTTGNNRVAGGTTLSSGTSTPMQTR
jgi:hypothetical protein